MPRNFSCSIDWRITWQHISRISLVRSGAYRTWPAKCTWRPINHLFNSYVHVNAYVQSMWNLILRRMKWFLFPLFAKFTKWKFVLDQKGTFVPAFGGLNLGLHTCPCKSSGNFSRAFEWCILLHTLGGSCAKYASKFAFGPFRGSRRNARYGNLYFFRMAIVFCIEWCRFQVNLKSDEYCAISTWFTWKQPHGPILTSP